MYAIYGNMDPINIPPMLAYIYIPYMDPMGVGYNPSDLHGISRVNPIINPLITGVKTHLRAAG